MIERPHQSPRPLTPVSGRSLPLVIDCDDCQVRGAGCADCVVSVLLGGPPADVDEPRLESVPAGAVTLNDEERRAVAVLAAAGLVPPLRLVTSGPQ